MSENTGDSVHDWIIAQYEDEKARADRLEVALEVARRALREIGYEETDEADPYIAQGALDRIEAELGQ